jgi:hypothetical protein
MSLTHSLLKTFVHHTALVEIASKQTKNAKVSHALLHPSCWLGRRTLPLFNPPSKAN